MAAPSTPSFLPVMFQDTLNKTIQLKMTEVPFNIVYKVNQLIWNEWWEKFTLTLRWLMSYIYGAPILDVSRSHTTTQHSR